MRFLLALLLPVMALAQAQVVGNPTGSILGIFAMCGTSPVNCGNGWCCLAGQGCTNGSKGDNTQCIDNSFTDGNGSTGVIVNAAYFGSLNEHQISPGNGSTTAKTTTQSLTSASTQLSLPVSYVVLSLVAGLVGLAL